MDQLKACAEIALIDCLNLRRQEQLLIICDPSCYEIGRAFYDAGEGKCKETMMAMVQSRKYDGNELPEAIGNLFSQFDIVVVPTSKALAYSVVSKLTPEQGVRIATLPGITNESFLRTMKTDWRKLGVYTRKIAGKLSSAQKITITTEAGTSLTFETGGRIARADDGRIMSKGTFGNLPAGEACLTPLEETAEGVLVIDGSFSLVEGMLEEPLVLTFKEGMVVKTEGNSCTAELEKIFVKYRHASRNLAEFGIGTHDTAILCGNILEDKKVRGAVHIAIGDTLSCEDTGSASIRLDGVLQQPSVWVNEKLLIDHGVYV